MLNRLTAGAMSDDETTLKRASANTSDIRVMKERRVLQPAFRLRELTKIFVFLDNARARGELRSSVRVPSTLPTRSDNLEDVHWDQPPPVNTPSVYLDSSWLRRTAPHHQGSPNTQEVWTVPLVEQMESAFQSVFLGSNIPRAR